MSGCRSTAAALFRPTEFQFSWLQTTVEPLPRVCHKPARESSANRGGRWKRILALLRIGVLDRWSERHALRFPSTRRQVAAPSSLGGLPGTGESSGLLESKQCRRGIRARSCPGQSGESPFPGSKLDSSMPRSRPSCECEPLIDCQNARSSFIRLGSRALSGCVSVARPATQPPNSISRIQRRKRRHRADRSRLACTSAARFGARCHAPMPRIPISELHRLPPLLHVILDQGSSDKDS